LESESALLAEGESNFFFDGGFTPTAAAESGRASEAESRSALAGDPSFTVLLQFQHFTCKGSRSANCIRSKCSFAPQ
jgi:hypothetical protein